MRMWLTSAWVCAALLIGTGAQGAPAGLQGYSVPQGSRPHDVAPAPGGGVWYTAQGSGELGHLDPATGRTHHIKLGEGSAPHGVIAGPDGAAWITDSGLKAIVRVDPQNDQVRRFPLPAGCERANLNTATGLPPHPTAPCTMRRWPAITSRASTWRAER
jgi:virginiamycin B lyase